MHAWILESVFMCERQYWSEFKPVYYSCFAFKWFWVFNIELRLDLGDRLLRFASRQNLELGPRYAEICLSAILKPILTKVDISILSGRLGVWWKTTQLSFFTYLVWAQAGKHFSPSFQCFLPIHHIVMTTLSMLCPAR